MSEFSQKLMDCIAASGYSIYQLAKEASLDRTTLQKTAKGQRLPSLDYIKDICRYMKISQKQEEELYRLYQIEKLGKDTVASWDEIHHIIVDIGGIRKKPNSNLNIHFKQQSFHHFNEDITREFSTELECMKAIMCVIEEELEEQEIPEVYMDVSWASQFALDQLMQSNSSQEKKLICHQLLNLRCTDEKRKVCLENIKMLHQVLPYAFTTQNKYDVRYAYVRENEAEEKFHLWAHYIVTKKHVVLCSNEKNHMVILSNEQIAEVYRNELEQMLQAYRPLFNYQGYSGEGIKKYRKLMDSDISFENIASEDCYLEQDQEKGLSDLMRFVDSNTNIAMKILIETLLSQAQENLQRASYKKQMEEMEKTHKLEVHKYEMQIKELTQEVKNLEHMMSLIMINSAYPDKRKEQGIKSNIIEFSRENEKKYNDMLKDLEL